MELNYTVLLDNKMAREFTTLNPAYSIPDSTSPFAISGCFTLLSPGINILTNYLADKTPPVKADTIIGKLKFVDNI